MSWLIPIVCGVLIVLLIICHKHTVRKRISNLRTLRAHKHAKELKFVGQRVKFEMFKEYIENFPSEK